MADVETEEKPKGTGFSFGFSRKQESKKLEKSIVSETVDDKQETDYVLSLEGKKVKSTNAEEDKTPKEYVIPLIRQNKWRGDDKLKNITSDSDENSSSTKEESNSKQHDEKAVESLSLEEIAAKEILLAASRHNETWEDRGKPDDSLSIPLLMQNKVPDGFESEDKLDVALRPDVPDDADYDQIPIEHFGMAMLRGMGWTEKRGVGKKGQNVAPIDALPRPKGLGLGAERSNTDKSSSRSGKVNDSEKEQNLVLKKGAYCFVTNGINKDLYGVVDGLDEDNSRAMVKLTLSGKTISIMQCHVQVVTKKDYDKSSKVLNKAKADKFKEDEEKKMEKKDRENRKHSYEQNGDRNHKRSKRGSSEDSDQKHHSKHKKHKKDKKSHKDHRDFHDSGKSKKQDPYSSKKRQQSDSENSSDEDTQTIFPWLRNDIRVRIIDKNLKKGRYYKEKVVIVDVPSANSCVCRTSDGKVIEDVPLKSVETVIPRSDDAVVAIVTGSHRGQLGVVMKRDKEKCMALVQLLSDRDTVLRLLYDHICEYVGDVNSFGDF